MTTTRFPWQVQVAQKYSGTVLNIGCNEDPAGLGSLGNVKNCDIEDHNPATGAKYPVDLVFDCTEKWPDVGDVDCAIFGDIVEHMYPHEFRNCLLQARRYCDNIAITLPRDYRIEEDPDYEEKIKNEPKGSVHITVWAQDTLKTILKDTGWVVTEFTTVHYDFVEEGYFIQAERGSWKD